MKKTLLAAALVVGFAGAAQAETSVTLYGIVDAGIGYQQVKGNSSYSSNRTDATEFKATKTGMISGVQSGSRWGLKGTEDLGSNLQAVFQLESGFDLGTGTHQQGDRLFGRQATLGLQSPSWGRLDLGRQTNIASKYLPAVADPFAAGFGQANIGAAMTSANTHRLDNMIMYQTPNFSGFQLGAGYSFNANGGQQYKFSGSDDTNKPAITAGLKYANGPIGVAATYDQQKNRIPGASDVTVKEWNVGGSFDFEVVKAYAAYGQTRNGFFSAEPFGNLTQSNNSALVGASAGYGDGLKVNSYLLGLSAPIGAGTILASWHMADPRSAPDAWDVPGNTNELSKQQTYSLGYTYALSKRTNVYAIGSYAKHASFRPDAKSTLFGVGLRHQF